jgi:hypothetical protein
MRPAAVQARIALDFEAANNSTVFTDTGTAGSTWSRGATGAVVTTSSPLVGAGSLFLPTQSDYIETNAVAGNMLPASADFDLSWAASSTNWAVGGVGEYMLSVQDASATAAGTQFVVATNASTQVAFIASNGTTRSVVGTSTLALTGTGGYSFLLTRRGNLFTLTVDGTPFISATWANNFAQPAGRKWRIGKPEFGSSNGSHQARYDVVRLIVY